MDLPTAMVDGVTSIASHNGVHRLTFFRLAADGKPAPVLELLVPPGAATQIADAFAKIRK